ncbi:MAG: S41 family peptidase [Clostridiales bacterium]|nr:S41 family peptidase [Clostridiales bacterium]
MRKKSLTISVIAALLITSILLSQPTFSYASSNDDALSAQSQRTLSEQLRELERFLKYIHENHKDEVDFETLMDGAFRGAIDALGDPHSVFHGDAARQATPQRVTGDYVGIGVQIETISSGMLAGKTTVLEVLEGSPAERAGIAPGDWIIAVDGQDVTSLLSVQISLLLRGEEGTTVSVTVDRGQQGEHTFVIERGRVVITSSFYEMIEDGIGYIKLLNFDYGKLGEFSRAKQELIQAGAKSLIIDVRDNPGGLINPALQIANRLVEEGDLLHLKHQGEMTQTVQATERERENVPVILLINENTGSSAEIFAAALQDNNAATLVGTKTYGKGTMQVRRETGNGNRFTISVYRFLRPNGEAIESIGITPDHDVRNRLGERREEAAKAYETFAPFMEETRPAFGDAGLNVFAAQQRLTLIGYSPSLTAVMDEATVSAIAAFQSDHGLWPGGILDFTTQNKIEQVTLSYINNDSEEDLQLLKAIELAKRNI